MTQGNQKIVRAACVQCQNQCGVLVTVRGEDEIVRIEGDRRNPLGGGGELCVKNSAALDFHDHPNRLNFPLKRAGRRGENRWQQISWEQALDEIADRLAGVRSQYGPEAMVVVGGNFRHGDTWAQRFCNLFGTPNMLYQGKNCGEVEIAMDCAALGYPAIGVFKGVVPGITRCVFIWGHNPAESFHLSFKNYRAAQEKGARIVVIDPRRTRTAEIAAASYGNVPDGTTRVTFSTSPELPMTISTIA
jgi:anaerobic selenocysteine-containing dehydrogenase